ncbi:MAG TPA: NAD-dependent epimerase/dehydratase family protein [Candidatus Nanoarchaeia archaeon]|nr:NAD-dependent epimerase/dehydratase family protein [Candidatus Nanoarchaeia archaeon]
MKILVTGGAGFIGSHLVDELSINKENEIIIVDNFHRGSLDNIRRHLKSKKVRLINCDIRDYNSLKNIGKIDLVYHCAAQSNVAGSLFNPDYAVTSNINGTYNVLKYSSLNNAEKFIFFSSREVYGNPEYLPVDESHPLNPINTYGMTKVCGEYLCRNFEKVGGIDVSIIRVANVYGPRDKERVIPIFLEKAKKNKDIVLFGGKQVLDFIWVGDVIKSIMKISAKDNPKGAINIGTGIGTSIEELARKIINATKSKSRIVIEKKRSMDVERFIAKSKIGLKATGLDKGISLMLQN